MVISIDGPNYAGKTTLIQSLKSVLEDRGYQVLVSKGVSDELIGNFADNNIDSIRQSPISLLHLLIADKIHFWDTVVNKNKRNNSIIIFDRYFLSLLSYQSLLNVPLKKSYNFIKELKYPDFEILLLPPSKILEERRKLREPTGNIEVNTKPQKEILLFSKSVEYLQEKNREFHIYQGVFEVEYLIDDIINKLEIMPAANNVYKK